VHTTGVIPLQNTEAASENDSIFNVEALEELGVPLMVCKLLRVV
jgi:hypothetical protein